MEINKVITNIDIDEDNILITLDDGTKLHFWHCQDCCEDVRIYDIQGNPHDLINKKLVMIEEEILDDIPEDFDKDDLYEGASQTFTDIKLITDKNTVICRWIGESNGYYSERVDFEEIAP